MLELHECDVQGIYVPLSQAPDEDKKDSARIAAVEGKLETCLPYSLRSARFLLWQHRKSGRSLPVRDVPARMSLSARSNGSFPIAGECHPNLLGEDDDSTDGEDVLCVSSQPPSPPTDPTPSILHTANQNSEFRGFSKSAEFAVLVSLQPPSPSRLIGLGAGKDSYRRDVLARH